MRPARRNIFVSIISVGLVWPISSSRGAEEPTLDQLFETGKALFDQFAPDEIKQQYEFPTKAQWDEFAQRLQLALQSDNISELLTYEDEAKGALIALRALPGYEDYADWLQERIDYIEAAKELGPTAPKPTPPRPPKSKTGSSTPPAVITIPNYELWLQRMRARPLPSQANALMPTLKAAFVAEGLPGELAWIAEAESTLNPQARSPAGAKGLFQLMPETAKGLGLSTFLPDERTDVGKSAQAAAKYLRTLHGKFGDWPLALAAYNAGEGRVRRLLKQKNADTFAEIAASLPSETRMYVPKVCATIAVRAGVSPDRIPSPRAS
ncbi:MAG: lytic transglycosylase domain-containing protein [Opitutus sp.]